MEEEFEVRDIIADLIEKEDEKGLEALLSERDLEIRIKTVEVEQREHKNFEVLVPVRKNYWEESCSVVVPHRTVVMPAREVADTCAYMGNLRVLIFLRKKTVDALHNLSIRRKMGRDATLYIPETRLVERYLAEIGGELIWVIWGERRQVFQNIDALYESFQEVKAYCDIRKASGGS